MKFIGLRGGAFGSQFGTFGAGTTEAGVSFKDYFHDKFAECEKLE